MELLHESSKLYISLTILSERRCLAGQVERYESQGTRVHPSELRRFTGFLGGQIFDKRAGNAKKCRIRAFRPDPKRRIGAGAVAKGGAVFDWRAFYYA